MHLSYFIAKRYLFSKRNRNAINIITGISVLVVAVSVAALIIVLSSINGFGKLINEQISVFAPDLKIEITNGKTFSINNKTFEKIKSLKGIKFCEEVLEDNILLKLGDKQLICTVKGVSSRYHKIYGLDSGITQGIFKTYGNNLHYGVLGAGVAYNLGISAGSGEAVSLWIPNRKNMKIFNPSQSFNKIILIPAGVISLDAEFDAKYILTSLDLVRGFTDRDSSTVSSLEILTDEKADIQKIKREIKTILGNRYTVKNLYEQFEVYKVMKSERLVTFIIMLFIILIASFSIIGSITMLIIEKKQDLFTLISMGASLTAIKKIFFIEGLLVTLTGTIFGLIFGGLLSYAQQKYGFVTFPSEGNYIVDAYPMDVKYIDFIYTFISVSIIGTLLSLYPAIKINSNPGFDK
jgi:lipoprotein-releasing system permease protein